MAFNPPKCYIMSISRKKNHQLVYALCGHILGNVESCKYMGINISQNLEWDTHIREIISKVSRIIGFWRNPWKSSCKLKELGYLSLVHSNLEYNACFSMGPPIIWKHLIRFKGKQTRFVVGNYSWKCNVPDRRRGARLVISYKIVNGLVPVEAKDYLHTWISNNSRNNLKYRHRQP